MPNKPEVSVQMQIAAERTSDGLQRGPNLLVVCRKFVAWWSSQEWREVYYSNGNISTRRPRERKFDFSENSCKLREERLNDRGRNVFKLDKRFLVVVAVYWEFSICSKSEIFPPVSAIHVGQFKFIKSLIVVESWKAAPLTASVDRRHWRFSTC